MQIAEFSRRTGLSTHTLRYYEKLGLLNDIRRDQAGRRMYQSKDIEWASFINRLKETGMPLKNIIRYAGLRSAGDSTLQQRQALLTEHRIQLQQRIREEQQHLNALDAKIEWYRQQT
ncbi:MAG: MerR family transcriptional regulator [Oceanospirillaceae bacterium]|nr:MerR family transcriptional regulator [Oceanospirillaceae bacterium]MBT12777.1 MerR family transcriptional regulator [Oceanospirillaceae bacterium]|tara:strand:- start:161382 stop:161732 length:351 start_codon:yes stop_codon:yes gene_type:complete